MLCEVTCVLNVHACEVTCVLNRSMLCEVTYVLNVHACEVTCVLNVHAPHKWLVRPPSHHSIVTTNSEIYMNESRFHCSTFLGCLQRVYAHAHDMTHDSASATLYALPQINKPVFCSWIIAPRVATQVTLTFTSVSTEADYDFIKVQTND
jgi:hypothetical protein